MTDPRAESEVVPMSRVAVFGHKARDAWICAMLTQHGVMTPLELRVAIRLGIFFNCKTAQCDPGYARLAKELGTSPRSVRRAVAALVGHGFISRDEGAGGSHDQKQNFSLFMPVRGTASVSSVQRTSSVSPVEAANSASHGGRKSRRRRTKTGDTGDRNKEKRGTTRRPTKEPDEPDEPAQPEGVVFDDPRTTRVERDSASSNNTADDAPVEKPPRPKQRAAEAALIEPIEAQQHQPSRDCSETAMGAAANGTDGSGFDRFSMAFARMSREYPRVADKAAALLAFDAAVRERGMTRVVEAITTMMEEHGADVPDLAEALKVIERTRPRMTGSQ